MKSPPLRAWVLCAILLPFCSFGGAATLQSALAAKDSGAFETAFMQFKQLATSGDAAAQFQLSLLYAAGRGTQPDAKESLYWLRLSAARGDPQAQSNLGVAFTKGRGVAQDLIRAWVWFSAAAVSGDSVATTNRDVVASKLTEQQRTQAKALLVECQSSGFKACL